MKARNPVVAGQFYPGSMNTCVDEIEECLGEVQIKEALPSSIDSAILPHAGWLFSGSVAASGFKAISDRHDFVDTFVIFGAAHGYWGHEPVMDEHDRWLTPLGEVKVDEELGEALAEERRADYNSNAHRGEHSIEVQVPFVQHLFPKAKILPVITGANDEAIKLGQVIGKIMSESDKKIVCLGSTDLTHYGPRYGIEFMGTGIDALKWVSEVNDMYFINAALRMDSAEMLVSAREHANACGAGAAAAAVEAARSVGKEQGVLLSHTSSHEVMLKKLNSDSEDSVGYASIVF